MIIFKTCSSFLKIHFKKTTERRQGKKEGGRGLAGPLKSPDPAPPLSCPLGLYPPHIHTYPNEVCRCREVRKKK